MGSSHLCPARNASSAKMEGEEKREESTIMGYFNEICKRDKERMAAIETNPECEDDDGEEEETEQPILGFEDVCREFGPWVWSDEIQDYQSSLGDLKGPHCRFHTAVPPQVEQISKKLLKLRWDPRDQEPFEGFGPWCLPLGEEPPPPIVPPKPVKKTRKKERPKSKSRAEAEMVPGPKAEGEKAEKDKVPAIVALTSHKTFSCPVDPIELKKRLSDLLIQRSAKGDQQAMELKKINMKPLYFKRFTLATNASTWLPRQPPIQMDKTVHRSQSSQIVKQQSASESNEPNQEHSGEYEPVKLPPVAKVNRIHDHNIANRFPRVAAPHHVRKRGSSQPTRPSESSKAISDHVSQEQQRNKLKNVSMNELVSRNSQSALGGIEKHRWGRKLGELSKNTKTEIFKQFSNFNI